MAMPEHASPALFFHAEPPRCHRLAGHTRHRLQPARQGSTSPQTPPRRDVPKSAGGRGGRFACKTARPPLPGWSVAQALQSRAQGAAAGPDASLPQRPMNGIGAMHHCSIALSTAWAKTVTDLPPCFGPHSPMDQHDT